MLLVTLCKCPSMVVITLQKGHMMVLVTLCKCPSMVVITLHRGPMMVASYVVQRSFNSWYYVVKRSYDDC